MRRAHERSHGQKGGIERKKNKKSRQGATRSQTRACGNFSNAGLGLQEFRELLSL